MKAKILIVGLVSTYEVARFATVVEAFHCADLLQASTNDKNLNYYVEYKEKGKVCRMAADSFVRRLPFLNTEAQEAIEEYYRSKFEEDLPTPVGYICPRCDAHVENEDSVCCCG